MGVGLETGAEFPLKRLAWLSDIHLDFLDPADVLVFCQQVMAEQPDAVLIGGDISVAGLLTTHLQLLEVGLSVPVFFVLGNHDYYGSSFADVREEMTLRNPLWTRLRWLAEAGVVPLTDRSALIGHGGWYDARNGDWDRSNVLLHDYHLIRELNTIDGRTRRAAVESQADLAAGFIREQLVRACEEFERVVLLTHVPPFAEACWHDGVLADDNWLPHFSSRVIGEGLRQVMSQYPRRQLLVLCGHAHGRGEAQILPNLKVKSAQATYANPVVQEIIEVE